VCAHDKAATLVQRKMNWIYNETFARNRPLERYEDSRDGFKFLGCQTRRVKIWTEAEDGQLRAPMEIGRSGNASRSRTTYVPSSTLAAGGSTRAQPSESGRYYLRQPLHSRVGRLRSWRPGDLQLQRADPSGLHRLGRRTSTAPDHDSFRVMFDADSDNDDWVWQTQAGNGWVWNMVNSAGRGVLHVMLDPGSHWMAVKQNETGTALDRIFISK
jgi:hypothetical protein